MRLVCDCAVNVGRIPIGITACFVPVSFSVPLLSAIIPIFRDLRIYGNLINFAPEIKTLRLFADEEDFAHTNRLCINADHTGTSGNRTHRFAHGRAHW